MPTLQDYRDRPRWSFSAINQFLNICSLQFAFDRVYKLRKAFTPLSLSFGSAFHRTLEWLSLSIHGDNIPLESEVRDRFRDFWQRQVAEDRDIRWEKDATQESCAEQGGDLVAAYLYAYHHLHGIHPAMRFDVIVTNKTPVVESHPTTRTLDQFHLMVELVKRIEKMIAAEHWLPNESGMYCAGCPY